MRRRCSVLCQPGATRMAVPCKRDLPPSSGAGRELIFALIHIVLLDPIVVPKRGCEPGFIRDSNLHLSLTVGGKVAFTVVALPPAIRVTIGSAVSQAVGADVEAVFRVEGKHVAMFGAARPRVAANQQPLAAFSRDVVWAVKFGVVCRPHRIDEVLSKAGREEDVPIADDRVA
eukprot:scaffold8596_cov63-Phaeocystis_antarctica.AAC.2